MNVPLFEGLTRQPKRRTDRKSPAKFHMSMHATYSEYASHSDSLALDYAIRRLPTGTSDSRPHAPLSVSGCAAPAGRGHVPESNHSAVRTDTVGTTDQDAPTHGLILPR